jgi:serine O-acetyltransferase
MLWYAPILLIPMGSACPLVEADLERWVEILDVPLSLPRRWARLGFVAKYREFRNLYFYRLWHAGGTIRVMSAFAARIYPGEQTLFLRCPNIGPGLFIQHGFATTVGAQRVGANCWINQQVTIGVTAADQERPILGDRVMVTAGAKVLGPVTLGDGATVGANAVVLQDVPPGCTAVGVPARILPPRE